jgi:sugar/nucleoside kinase (ribokinase family)
MSRVVVLGDVMTDVVAVLERPFAPGSDAPARIERHFGGSGANVAAWLAAAGTPVTLVARVGADEAGRTALAALEAAGVETCASVDPALPTGTCIVLVGPGGERSMVPDAGANAALAPARLPTGSHLHVAGYALLREGSRAAARAAIALARGRGMPVSVDPSSAVPLATAGAFLEWAAGADLLLPNAAEAAALTGEADPERAARALAAGGAEVVVTLGADGALWTDGRLVARAEAEPVAEVVDTTGAGDAFTAGLLAARLGGAGPGDALRSGCRLAARAVVRTGGYID